MEDISIAIAFSAGLLTFLSPCVLPLVPVYFASLYGPEIFESELNKRRFTIFFHSASFVLGFSTIFILLGAGAGLTGLAIGRFALSHNIAGIMLVAFGLFMLLALKIPQLNITRAVNYNPISNGYLRSLLTGGVFSLAWTPCVGPILAGILAFAISSQTAWQGAYLLGIYSLGLGLPFLAVGILFDYATPWLRRLNRYSAVFQIISAALLITVGVLILTNKLTWIQSQLIIRGFGI